MPNAFFWGLKDCCVLQVNDQNPVLGSPGELLSRRCITLLKIALKSEMWHGAELKLQWFDKLLMTVVSSVT